MDGAGHRRRDGSRLRLPPRPPHRRRPYRRRAAADPCACRAWPDPDAGRGRADQGSHAVYYAFGTLHWQAAGHSDDVIGLLWAEGVVCEIVLFAAGAAVRRRISAPWLIAVAGALAALRWLVLGSTTALPAVIAVQALHAFSYGPPTSARSTSSPGRWHRGSRRRRRASTRLWSWAWRWA
ncbi:MAG: MFS transporter [Rhodoplanes sp.]